MVYQFYEILLILYLLKLDFVGYIGELFSAHGVNFVGVSVEQTVLGFLTV